MAVMIDEVALLQMPVFDTLHSLARMAFTQPTQ